MPVNNPISIFLINPNIILHRFFFLIIHDIFMNIYNFVSIKRIKIKIKNFTITFSSVFFILLIVKSFEILPEYSA